MPSPLLCFFFLFQGCVQLENSGGRKLNTPPTPTHRVPATNKLSGPPRGLRLRLQTASDTRRCHCCSFTKKKKNQNNRETLISGFKQVPGNVQTALHSSDGYIRHQIASVCWYCTYNFIPTQNKGECIRDSIIPHFALKATIFPELIKRRRRRFVARYGCCSTQPNEHVPPSESDKNGGESS